VLPITTATITNGKRLLVFEHIQFPEAGIMGALIVAIESHNRP
jgi:hypothetical protein